MSDSSWPHELQHIKLPCPWLSPGVCSNSCPLSWWCHPITSFSAAPFSACLQSFPASGSFPMTCLLASGGQYIGASASESIFPMNIHKWSFRIDWLDLLAVQGISRVFFNTTVWKHQFFSAQLSLRSNSHSHTWLLEENIALTIWTFVSKVMSLLLNMLSRLVIALLSRSKHLLISWLQSPSEVILEPKKRWLALKF